MVLKRKVVSSDKRRWWCFAKGAFVNWCDLNEIMINVGEMNVIVIWTRDSLREKVSPRTLTQPKPEV